MRDGNFPAVFFCERVQRVQQNRRIRATGNGDEDFLSAQKQTAVPDFAFHALEKFAHAVSLHFFGVAGKRWPPKWRRGGDRVSRKRKWPEKQKDGKKRMSPAAT